MTYQCVPCGAYQANCYMVYDANGTAAVIDPGDDADVLLQIIHRHGLKVKAVLLTHAHFDHMMAAEDILAHTGAQLMIGEADEAALTDTRRSLMPIPSRLTADRTLCDGDTVAVGTLMFRVLHTPGHTPGSVCYECEGILFSGDTVFCGSVGRTDLPGGDFSQLCESLGRVAALPSDWRIAPGHGSESTIGLEQASNPFMMGR